MPSNYDDIRRDNIRRFGEETKHLAPLRDLYADRTHLVEELMQNAEDAGASSLQFKLFTDRLELSHDGRAFTASDVHGLCGVADSTKLEDLTQIGRFGIGFKSVFAYTDAPRIHSGDEHFRLEHFVRPHGHPAPPGLPSHVTNFVFPFDRVDPGPDVAASDLAEKFRTLSARALLFLRGVRRIRATSELDGTQTMWERGDVESKIGRTVRLTTRGGSGESVEDWLVFERIVSRPDGGRAHVEIAYRHTEQGLTGLDSSPLVVFFPTAIETGLGFLVQGPYRTTPARDNVPRSDDWNRLLVRETAELVVESLRSLAQAGWLNLEVLKAMPTDGSKFGEGSMFNPIYKRVRDALRTEALLPTRAGGYTSAAKGRVAQPNELAALLSDEQLSLFLDVNELRWLHPRIQPRLESDLYRYLTGRTANLDFREPIVPGVEIKASAMMSLLDASKLESQSDEWMAEFYGFLADHRSSREAAKSVPILRLQDGSQVRPLDEGGHPVAYLPPQSDGFLCVSPNLLQHQGATQLLRLWGFTKPDQFAEVIKGVIPRLHALDPTSPTAVASGVRDMKRVMDVYRHSPSERRSQLVAELIGHPCVVGVNVKVETPGLFSLSACYVNRPGLLAYLRALPETAVLHPGYRDIEEDLVEFGLRSGPEMQAGFADKNGYVTVRAERGDHARGLDGFDPDFSVHGLAQALALRDVDVNRYVWNELLGPEARPLRGRVEECSRRGYEDSTIRATTSPVGRVATQVAWLPDRKGQFHVPSELQPSDLADGFHPNDSLARHLGMRSDEHAILAESLGATQESIQLYLLHQDEFQEFLEKKKSLEKRSAAAETTSFQEAVVKRFNQGPKGNPDRVSATPGPVENPALRRRRVGESVRAEKERDGGGTKRVRVAAGHIWETRNPVVREFLGAEYGGRCQICGEGFLMANGDPYFEAVYLVSRTVAQWMDRAGNALCLCAEHSARFRHGARVVEDLPGQVLGWRSDYEDGDSDPTIRMVLCELPVEIRYTERHMIDLQEMIKADLKPDATGD